METKLDNKRMKVVGRRCGFLNETDIRVNETRGGLYLAWREELSLTLR